MVAIFMAVTVTASTVVLVARFVERSTYSDVQLGFVMATEISTSFSMLVTVWMMRVRRKRSVLVGRGGR